jgi:hypothetical protein
MITFQYVVGESKTGEKGVGFSHYEATASNPIVGAIRSDFDGVGDTPLEAMNDLALQMYSYILANQK